MNLKTITSTSGKTPMGHSHSTHAQRGEPGWLKSVMFGHVGEGGDLQGQVCTHKYKKNTSTLSSLIDTSEKYKHLHIHKKWTKRRFYTSFSFLVVSTPLFHIIAKSCFKKIYDAHTLMLLTKIKTYTHSVTLTCLVLFRSSGKFCKIEGLGEGVCKK